MSIFSPVINGNLRPEKRSGHVCVYHQGRLVVFGGYGDGADDVSDDFMSSKTVWCFNIEVSQWTRHTAKGELPMKCTGACAEVMGDCMIMFGGYAQHEGHTNQVFSLDLHNFIWKNLSANIGGTPPSLRDKFGCWTYRNKIIYFGGFGHPPDNLNKVKGEFCFEELPSTYCKGFGWNNHVFVLKFDEHLTWRQPTCTGDVPCPRAAFSTTQLNQWCFLFGGRFKDERKNDLFCFDANSFAWQQLEPIGMIPCGRSWQILEVVSGNHLFMYGGFDNGGGALKDTWLYNIEQNTWMELPSASHQLDLVAPRMWHASSTTDSAGEVIIFGGCVNSVIGEDHTIHTNAISIFRYSPLSLQWLSLDYIVQNIGRYSIGMKHLPRSLQRSLHHRSLALGLNLQSGHGKLINNCQIM